MGGKLAAMRPHLNRQAATGTSRVPAIGPRVHRVWTASERPNLSGAWFSSFAKVDRRVSCYYFYLWDVDFGLSFVKICSYFHFPCPVKI